MKTLNNYVNKPLILSSCLIYVFSLIIGVIISKEIQFSFNNEELSNNPLYYFNHNFLSCLYIISGLLLFSLTTLWTLFLNGVMLGATFAGVSIAKSISEATASIFFHGIFEIPAIILSGAIGLYPCYIIYLLLRNTKNVNYKEHLRKIGVMFLLVIIFLLIASIMEAKISPIIISHFYR